MLVAQSFAYSPSKPTSKDRPASRVQEKPPKRDRSTSDHTVRGFGWRPDSYRQPRDPQDLHDRHRKPTQHGEESTGSDIPSSNKPGRAQPSANASALPHRSRPVAVPTKSTKTQRESRQSVRSPAADSPSSAPSSSQRDPASMSPSARRILAATMIPRKNNFPRPRNPRPSQRRISIDELVEEWKQMDEVESASLGTSPSMDLLLSPPDHSPAQSAEESEDRREESPPSRSASNESMPSLELDQQSIQSSITPSTPAASVRGSLRSRGRPRGKSSPRSLNTALDHPLVPTSPVMENSDVAGALVTVSRQRQNPRPHEPSPRKPSQPRRQSPSSSSSFKSNLTASLSRLRNVGRSFSNFAAPSFPPDDHLSRALFGEPIPYGPEMRPQPLSSPPSAELRRYLNPHAFQPYDFHLHTTHMEQIDLEAAAARAADDPRSPFAPADVTAIPLEQYKGKPKQQLASDTAGDGRLQTEARRQRHRREPRENPEFLRICVLETQMRRAGKMEGPAGMGGMGRKGWWLPPRKVDGTANGEADGTDGGRKKMERSAARWRGEVVDHS